MNKLLWVRTCMCTIRRNMCAPPSGASPSSGSARDTMATPKYRPSDFQKFILVWTKKYKSKADIPTFVSPDLIERSRSEARIKIANVLMLLTALASFGAVLAGKAAVKRGESVHQMNLDWHKEYKESFERKEAEKSK
ncbi:UPF0389 protein CG9231 [Pectinophora gossypiella]|uniref:Uncharacterized protein n=1 Tax=Pectinophora gossypiella TaxID=13191 RepID=A0A1E1WEG4_PECGO|nr:UPF0389 protein CG9231 [Pectinophora gossypiella]